MSWAFAKLGYYSYAFQRASLKTYADKASNFTSQEVCNLLWACTRQRFHPEVRVWCMCMCVRVRVRVGVGAGMGVGVGEGRGRGDG